MALSCVLMQSIYIIIALAQMQKENSSYPIYKYCISQNIEQRIGQLVSIVGKVTLINPEQSLLTLEVDPQQAKSIKVVVPELTVNYLLDETNLNNLKEKEDLLLVEKYINKCKKNSKGAQSLGGDNNRTSLMWFTVDQNQIPTKKSTNNTVQTQEKKNVILPASLIKTISAGQFSINQYIEVRGMCLNATTIEMQQFTDFEQNYNLQAHNRALRVGFKYCEKIVL